MLSFSKTLKLRNSYMESRGICMCVIQLFKNRVDEETNRLL